MLPINKLPYSYDVSSLASELLGSPDWGEYNQRRLNNQGPHREMEDIWVRYNDPEPFIENGNWAEFNNEHDAVWLKDYAAIKRIAYDLLEKLEGSQLGGVLLTKLPPGGKIYPHTDSGWHAGYYDKYWVPIVNETGARFCFEGCVVEPLAGEVWAFRNDVNHWVCNDSKEVKISLIICIRQNKLSPEGLCLGDMQR